MRSERGGGGAEPARGNLVSPVNRDYYLRCVGSILSVRALNHSILLLLLFFYSAGKEVAVKSPPLAALIK